MEAPVIGGTMKQQQAIRDLVHLGLGGAVVEICCSLRIDGGWLECLALDEMRLRDLASHENISLDCE